MDMKQLCLGVIGSHPTVEFAAEEIKRYLCRMDHSLSVKVIHADRKQDDEGILWLGAHSFFDVCLPVISDSHFDDAIAISVTERGGYITGSNERSILIAAYRFLTELGCRWVRPGTEGERIPQKDLSHFTIEVCESASCRHRGVCIEGACSCESVLDMVDYLPKVAMNTYFIQSMNPKEYIRRWYNHSYNPMRKRTPVSEKELDAMLERIKAEMDKRSMLDHRCGHGWTHEAFGKNVFANVTEDLEGLDEEAKALIAQTNGKRQLFLKHMDTTNLCYSNPKAREGIVNAVVDYCRKNPQTDAVHVWLADMPNNHCECDACSKKTASDWYMVILNQIDRKLREEKLDTKIVFLLYYDLLWAPQTEQFENPDRFVLMFAPASRDYGKNYGDFLQFDGVIPPFRRNKLEMPRNLAENIAHLKNWQALFDGDSFAYEYHLMWSHCGDLGYEKCAQNLYGDIRDLEKIGLNGFISVQSTKTFFPTALPFYVMAKTLWNTDSDYEALRVDYYSHAFGKDWEMVHKYLNTLSQLITLYDQPPFGDNTAPYGPFCTDYARLEETCKGFEPVLAGNIARTDETASDWALLPLYARYISLLTEVIKLREERKDEQAKQAFIRFRDFLREQEATLEWVYDAFETPRIVERKIFEQK